MSDDLFGSVEDAASAHAPQRRDAASRPVAVPLAERMRPASLDEVAGQAHLLGTGKPLRLACESYEMK